MKKLCLAFALVLAFALAPLAQANATILFVGGEDSDFISLTGAAASTTAGTFSSGYARESISVTGLAGGGFSADPPGNSFYTPTFTASSVIWIHANLDLSFSGPGTGDILRVFSPDGYPRILVSNPSPVGQFNILTENQSGTETTLVSMISPCWTTNHLLALDLYINYSSSGEVTLYCNGTQVADYTGNITTNSATQLDQIQFGGIIQQNGITYWSEIIVSTTNTRSMRVAHFAPAANGNTDNWDIGGVSNINPTTLNTANVNASGTAGEIQEYTVNSQPSGTFNVLGLWLNADAQVGTTGPQHLQGVVYTGGSAYTSSNYSPTQGAWGPISIPFLTNPNTGVAWTTNDLNNASFNIGFESQN